MRLSRVESKISTGKELAPVSVCSCGTTFHAVLKEHALNCGQKAGVVLLVDQVMRLVR